MTMFWVLCTIVCLAIFLMATAVGTVAANGVAKVTVHRKCQNDTQYFAELLFCLRLFPVVMAVAVTFGFALPSFLLLEPKPTIERPEPGLLLLAFCAAVAIAVFVERAIHLFLTTKRIVGEWSRAAKPLHVAGLSVPIYIIERPESLIAAAGFFRPKIFLGRAAFASLADHELRAAIAHESAHVRSLDNLKRFLLHVTRLPKYFRSLALVETNWLQASELAADQGALELGISPLDLASTLVKIGRLKTAPSATLAVSHFVPPSCSSTVAMRVHWLQGVLAETSSTPASRTRRFTYPAVGLLMIWIYLMTLPASLPIAHRLIEWLVR